MQTARQSAATYRAAGQAVQGSSSAAPRPQRQDRRREANPLAAAGRSAIPNLHPLDLDGTNPRLDHPCRTVTVPDNTVATVGQLQVLHGVEKRLGLDLDSPRQQLPCAARTILVSGSSISSG